MFYFFKQLSLRAIIWNIQGHSEEETSSMCRKSILKVVMLFIALSILTYFSVDKALEVVKSSCMGSKVPGNEYLYTLIGLTSVAHVVLLFLYNKSSCIIYKHDKMKIL
eukprot:UN23207